MRYDPTTDSVLSRFRSTLSEIYGDRLARVVLYGSRARGDYRPDSDYDVAVFLYHMPDRGAEIHRIADLETDILYDTGAVINAVPFPIDAYRERTGFMRELRQDGLDL
jgi:predicted nucleotidyltransferase